MELHEYLLQHVVGTEKIKCPTVSDVKNVVTFENVLDYLKPGYEILKRQNCSTLLASISYGEWLNIAFELHSIAKLAGKTFGTWKEFIETNIRIQDSYARKLREIATLFGNYPRFKTLGLTFAEIYSRRNQIKSMLAVYTAL